jgi:glycosyltransferase involved in cell wall biosynthesis
MKILQVLPTLSAGGAEGFVTNLGVSLAALGAEVRFFLLSGVRGERSRVLSRRLEDAGIEVDGREERAPASVENLLRLARLIRSWKPEIVQANLYSTEVACSAARFLSIGNNACYVRRLANTDTREYCRFMDRFYRQTIACSPAVAEAYRGFMGEKQKSKLITIPNGGLLQDAVTSTEERAQAREILGIPYRSFVVAHIGRMFPGGGRMNGGLETGQKAHDVLIRAFAMAFGSDSDSLLTMVGDGPSRPQAEALAKSLGIVKQIRFLGQQPEPWPVLKAADMFCFPSRHEGSPNVLPEAASCGLPVVASDIPEIRSLYPGDAWLLKPVNDVEAFANGLRTIRGNIEVFANKARDLASGIRERYSMKVCAAKYLQAYDQALGVKGSYEETEPPQ